MKKSLAYYWLPRSAIVFVPKCESLDQIWCYEISGKQTHLPRKLKNIFGLKVYSNNIGNYFEKCFFIFSKFQGDSNGINTNEYKDCQRTSLD